MNYKGFIISSAPTSPSLYKVATEGQGGKIPNVLLGLFTSKDVVTQLIDMYLETQKGADNGKTTTKRGTQRPIGGFDDGSLGDAVSNERNER